MHKDTISRRKFGLAAGATSIGLMTSDRSAAANERGTELVNYSRGRIEAPPTYYEVLEPAGGTKKPPMVLISGGAHTGACYLATADGRPGWAHAFVRGSQLKITDLSNYRGRRILVMTGTADADHPRKLDESIVEWLNQNGAKADFIYLGDRGIVGNGHMMMLENNSDTLADHIVSWIESG